MAAIVTGLIPILRTAVDATTTYKGRSLWFGFLCIRVVILFLAQMPFNKLDHDFACNGTSDSVCTKTCFNRHFHKPLVVAWHFIFVLVTMSILLMELFTSHLRSLAQKRSSKMRTDVELEGQGEGEAQAVSRNTMGQTILDFHKDRRTTCFYLLSIILRILIESWFVYVLLFWNLPALNNEPYKCTACSEFSVCVVRAAPEKRWSIYALASISCMIVVCSLSFCVYSTVHYLAQT